MPRKARKKSSSGIYHIMLRGINRQLIFEDDEDKSRFLETLKKYKEISKYQLYSYCLMDNHIHLLLKESEEGVSEIIKRISSSYVYWYNLKYERCGHLFQDRFKSENVENSAYFLTVLRYIHQNPIKAGLEKTIFESKWTSIDEYIGKMKIVDIDFGLNLLSADRSQAIKLFIEYMPQTNDDQCLDDMVKVTRSDSEVLQHLYKLGITNKSQLQQMDKKNRDATLIMLKKLNGVTVKQLSRITGISKSTIYRLR
ncbi:transposase [Bacillaceae bacterium IKA-2]|nr:transposase [Bacillaceae bacterium IKA-2]